MKTVELNHMIGGSFLLSGSGVPLSKPVIVSTPHPVFDLKAGSLFKLDAPSHGTSDRAQVKALGDAWNK